MKKDEQVGTISVYPPPVQERAIVVTECDIELPTP